MMADIQTEISAKHGSHLVPASAPNLTGQSTTITVEQEAWKVPVEIHLRP
jgi:hypothetical protein